MVVGASLSALLVVGGQAAVSANVTWCAWAPPIPVVTPGGNHLMVNNMVYLPVSDAHLASQITDDASVQPDGQGGTLITVHIHIPREVHAASVVSQNNRYKVTDTKSTSAGGTVLTLKLDVPTS